MAHFAVVNSENRVLEVIVISNDEILDGDGNESEALGRAKCAEIRTGQDHLGTQSGKGSQNGCQLFVLR